MSIGYPCISSRQSSHWISLELNTTYPLVIKHQNWKSHPWSTHSPVQSGDCLPRKQTRSKRQRISVKHSKYSNNGNKSHSVSTASRTVRALRRKKTWASAVSCGNIDKLCSEQFIPCEDDFPLHQQGFPGHSRKTMFPCASADFPIRVRPHVLFCFDIPAIDSKPTWRSSLNNTTFIWLVVSTPLINISQLGLYMIPNIWKNKTCSKPPNSYVRHVEYPCMCIFIPHRNMHVTGNSSWWWKTTICSPQKRTPSSCKWVIFILYNQILTYKLCIQYRSYICIYIYMS